MAESSTSSITVKPAEMQQEKYDAIKKYRSVSHSVALLRATADAVCRRSRSTASSVTSCEQVGRYMPQK